MKTSVSIALCLLLLAAVSSVHAQFIPLKECINVQGLTLPIPARLSKTVGWP